MNITVGKHTFEVVQEVPKGYLVWNIPTKGLEGYIPLYNGDTVQGHSIDTNTLKVVKCLGWEEICYVAGLGARNILQAQRMLNRLNNKKRPTRWDIHKIEKLERALTFMKLVQGL